jgi:glucosamine 6-phosphate synthetase-like amidotransferase/phosphosugar isomerase protein
VDWSALDRMSVVACGTAHYAGMVAKYWLEGIARLPADIEIASEFRYREPPLRPGGAAIFVSQSGETADTLAALRYAQAAGQTTVAVVNVETSTMAREADVVVPIHAGPEIGVASTKAFTAQLIALAALSGVAARRAARWTPRRRRVLPRTSRMRQARWPRHWSSNRPSQPWPTRSPMRAARSSSDAARCIRWRWKARSS